MNYDPTTNIIELSEDEAMVLDLPHGQQAVSLLDAPGLARQAEDDALSTIQVARATRDDELLEVAGRQYGVFSSLSRIVTMNSAVYDENLQHAQESLGREAEAYLRQQTAGGQI